QAFGSARAQRVSLIDADVSTVTAAADKVLRVEGDGGPWLLDIEPEARYAADAPDRLLLYSTILRQRHRLPVRSVLLLLRREANASNLTAPRSARRRGERATLSPLPLSGRPLVAAATGAAAGGRAGPAAAGRLDRRGGQRPGRCRQADRRAIAHRGAA